MFTVTLPARRPILMGLWAVTFAGLFFSTGCLQFAANLMHVVSGPEVPAECKGLEGKRVAIVATDESGICRDEVTIRLAGVTRGLLSNKLPKTSFINQEEIDGWLNTSSASNQDFIAIGQGVKADRVIVIELLKLQLRDGPTLYRGRSDLNVTVLDVATGKPIFEKSLPDFAYPTMAGQSATETDEDKFRRVYLMRVADKVARYFYSHDFGADVAIDATILSYDR